MAEGRLKYSRYWREGRRPTTSPRQDAKSECRMKRIGSWPLAAIVVAVFTQAAAAQTWPVKPVRVIIPFAAGSFTDVLPRVVFDQVGKQLGQTFVVENRTGAGGTI